MPDELTESELVDFEVATWYAQPQKWMPQGKTTQWPDRVLLDQGALIDNKLVLNLGCFYPEDEEAFAHRADRWHAIDFVPSVIERCWMHTDWPEHVTFSVADMRTLPFLDETFEVVTDFSSGDHLLREDWERVIAEVARVLKPGGHFLVCFANHDAFVNVLGTSDSGVPWAEEPAQHGEYGYVRTDTLEQMTTALESRGFQIVRVSHTNVTQLRAGVLAIKPY